MFCLFCLFCLSCSIRVRVATLKNKSKHQRVCLHNKQSGSTPHRPTLDALTCFVTAATVLGHRDFPSAPATCFPRLDSQASSDSTLSPPPPSPALPPPGVGTPPSPPESVSVHPPPAARRMVPGGGTTTSAKVAWAPQGVLSGERRPSIRRFESQPAGMKAASDVCVVVGG